MIPLQELKTILIILNLENQEGHSKSSMPKLKWNVKALLTSSWMGSKTINIWQSICTEPSNILIKISVETKVLFWIKVTINSTLLFKLGSKCGIKLTTKMVKWTHYRHTWHWLKVIVVCVSFWYQRLSGMEVGPFLPFVKACVQSWLWFVLIN